MTKTSTNFYVTIWTVIIFVIATPILNGQILYTDISPDIILSGDDYETYDLDLNQDGTLDFSISHMYYNPTHMIELTSASANCEALEADVNHPSSIENGESIGSDCVTWAVVNYAYIYQTDDASSNWGSPQDRYLGLRIKISGKWHYAWARLNIPADGSSVTIMDFAYNSVQDQAITAGDNGSIAVSETSEEVICQIYPNPCSDYITINISENMLRKELIIVDLNGYERSCPLCTGKENTLIINVSHLPEGLYFMKAENDCYRFIKMK